MAYMNQEKKKEIAKLLKAFMPKSWKYTLSVSNYSTLNFNLKSAPVDLLGMIMDWQLNNTHCGQPIREKGDKPLSNISLTHIRYKEYFSGDLLVLLNKIIGALNLNNYDNSDSQIDYFDVGHYTSLNIGDWGQPFINTGA